jgi:beta-N-acetylhexosaminidase
MSLGPLMLDVAGLELTAADRELLAAPAVGGVILFTRNYASREQLNALTRSIHALRTPPLIVSVDHEGGRVQRFREGFTALPSAHLIGRQYDIDPRSAHALAEDVGYILAAELLACGVDLSFAPVLDLARGVSEVIGDRAFHRDPGVVGELGQACMTGMRAAGMAAVAKHFPGHGAVVADSHVSQPVDRRFLEEIEEDMAPFARLVRAGAAGMMMAHVVYPALDSLPASLSQRWIHGLLRQQLDFRGVVCCDDLSMAGAAVTADPLERARLALAAGCDLLLVCNDRAAAERLVEALADYSDPVSQVRLARMHGRRHDAAGDESRRLAAVARIERLDETPSLRLDA